jgi:hypothetical protein
MRTIRTTDLRGRVYVVEFDSRALAQKVSLITAPGVQVTLWENAQPTPVYSAEVANAIRAATKKRKRR